MFQLCSEGYFKTMGRHLLRGRLLTESDVDGTRPVAVINDTFAKAYFKEEDPIGQKITCSTSCRSRRKTSTSKSSA